MDTHGGKQKEDNNNRNTEQRITNMYNINNKRQTILSNYIQRERYHTRKRRNTKGERKLKLGTPLTAKGQDRQKHKIHQHTWAQLTK